MNQEERISDILSGHKALFFISCFLLEHPEAQLYLVGGAIRDALLKRRMREVDFDFVIAGLESPQIETWFRKHGELNLVGQHFGVYKFMPNGCTPEETAFIDIALPRTEAVANGSLGGYKDFDIQSDPHLPIEQDLARRDFTINAMAFNVRTQTLIDPFNGQVDLAKKTIRAVGDPMQRFTEDLSRILRSIRFASELNFVIEDETSQAIKQLTPRLNLQRDVDGKLEYVIPRETIGVELAKALSRNPSRAISQLFSQGALQELFPRVSDYIQQVPQYLSPITKTVPGELSVVLVLLLRALSQDEVRETLSFTGLDTLSRGSSQRIEPHTILASTRLLQSAFTPPQIHSMRASEFEKNFFNEKGRLFTRCLELLEQRDLRQAIQTRRIDIENRWLVDHDEAIAPLLSGQDILAKGISAGPDVRMWLDRVRDLQLDGNLMRREDALQWLEQELKQKSSR